MPRAIQIYSLLALCPFIYFQHPSSIRGIAENKINHPEHFHKPRADISIDNRTAIDQFRVSDRSVATRRNFRSFSRSEALTSEGRTLPFPLAASVVVRDARMHSEGGHLAGRFT